MHHFPSVNTQRAPPHHPLSPPLATNVPTWWYSPIRPPQHRQHMVGGNTRTKVPSTTTTDPPPSPASNRCNTTPSAYSMPTHTSPHPCPPPTAACSGCTQQQQAHRCTDQPPLTPFSSTPARPHTPAVCPALSRPPHFPPPNPNPILFCTPESEAARRR